MFEAENLDVNLDVNVVFENVTYIYCALQREQDESCKLNFNLIFKSQPIATKFLSTVLAIKGHIIPELRQVDNSVMTGKLAISSKIQQKNIVTA
jgi:hypothetical protein